MELEKTRFTGSCHCGAVRFSINSHIEELTTCDCSICQRKNALMTQIHHSEFELLSGEDSLSVYQFHTNTAKHYFCKVCGIYPFHRKRVAPDSYGINVFCLEGFNPDNYRLRATDGKGMS